MREARLDAQQCRYQLQRAHDDLADLRQQVAALSSAAPASADVEAARMEAADCRYKQQLAELELAKQLDALQELHWQLDSVVSQLGLQPAPSTSGGGGQAAPAGPAAAAAAPTSASAAVDHLQLLAKVEELRHSKLQLDEYKRRLAAAEAQLAVAQGRAATHQQDAASAAPGVAVPAGQQPGGTHGDELGAGGRVLVGELLQENEALRWRLAEAEVCWMATAAGWLHVGCLG